MSTASNPARDRARSGGNVQRPTPNAQRPTKKRVTPRAASFRRIAKCLRIRARNHSEAAAMCRRSNCTTGEVTQLAIAESIKTFAAELDNEAATLRAMS